MNPTFETNAPINRKIGSVGFDSITFSNLMPQFTPFQTPICKTVPSEIRRTPSCTMNLSIQKCRIYGPDYIFSYGNQGDRPFSKLKIRASKEGQDNLQNRTLDEMKTRAKEILSEIFHSFSIRTEYDETKIRIYDAELNITVPIKYPLDNYKRIFNLMACTLGENTKQATVTDNNQKLETFYLLSGMTKKYTIYSKSNDISNKIGIDSDTNLLRYEIFASEQTLSALSCHESDKKTHQLHLSNINGRDIEQYFFSSTETLFKKTAAYLAKKNKATSPTKNKTLLQRIYPIALRRILRADTDSLIEAVLHEFHAAESKTGDPVLFDLSDFYTHIKESDLSEADKEQICKTLKDMEDHSDRFDPICKVFIGQNDMLHELRYKLTNRNTYNMTLLQTKNNKLLIWWDNPTHQTIPNLAKTNNEEDNDPFSPDRFDLLLYQKTNKNNIKKATSILGNEIYYTIDKTFLMPGKEKNTITVIKQEMIENIHDEIKKEQQQIITEIQNKKIEISFNQGQYEAP